MIKHCRQLWEIFSEKDKKIFFLLVIASFFNSILEIASVGALFPLIFSLLAPETVNTIPFIKEFLESYAPVRGRNFILIALAVTVVGFILKNIFFGCFIWFRSKYIERIGENLSRRLFLKYMLDPYQSHIQRDTATIIRNFDFSVESFKIHFLGVIIQLITHTSIGISYLIFLSYVDSVLIFYFITIMTLIMLLITLKIRRTSRRISQETVFLKKEISHNILSGLMGFKEIKVLMKEFFYIDKFTHLVQNNTRNTTRMLFNNSLPQLIIETSIVFLGISAIIILFAQNQEVEIIIAKLGVFAFAALKIFPMFNFFGTSLNQLAIGGASLETLYQELIIENPVRTLVDGDSVSKAKAPRITPFKKTIELRNVFFHFIDESGKKKDVLNGINLTILKNSTIGLVGSSGSGKTTLADVIIGFMRPQEGEILIDGKPLQGEGIWSDRIGYIPQQIYLSNTSIKQNIALGIDEDSIEENRIWEVLKTAQLQDFVNELPNGVNTTIGESGVKLSGGQRQRVGIARSLYHKPEILILDEATSALDNRTELEFTNQLRGLNLKATQIIIAHRLTTVKHCDKILVLDQGRIVEQGTYAQLERSGKYFRGMLLKDLKHKPAKRKTAKKTGR